MYFPIILEVNLKKEYLYLFAYQNKIMEKDMVKLEKYFTVFVLTLVVTLLFSFSTFGQLQRTQLPPNERSLKEFPLLEDPIEGTGTCDVLFKNEEILSMPTKNSVELSMLPGELTQLYVKYGLNGSTLDKKTKIKTGNSERNVFFTLNNLSPDQKYEYQVFCKRPYETRFRGRSIHDFRTLRENTDDFSFSYFTDTHVYALWSQYTCSPSQPQNPGFEQFEKVRDTIISEDVDFVVLGGDWAMINCAGCKACTVDGKQVSAGSSTTQQDANLRYQKILEYEVFGELFKETPFVYVKGDHEGEGGWMNNTNIIGKKARLKYLPNPHNTYSGDKDGGYYSFETGPVQIIVIDVMTNTINKPFNAEDWTLGKGQLQWLEETLANSNKKWKLIFAEHLVGGENSTIVSASGLWKGRGSIQATDDNTPTGIYKGEQAQVEALMQKYGAQMFIQGNDHIASIGEKLYPNGTLSTIHIIGGSNGVGGAWINDPIYIAEMTFPGYSMASYETNTIGTKAVGHFRVDVNGEESLFLEFVNLNNVPVFNYTLQG